MEVCECTDLHVIFYTRRVLHLVRTSKDMTLYLYKNP